MTTCVMTLIETANFKYFWECSECLKQFKATFKFETNTRCPSCNAKPVQWVGLDEDDE